MTDKTRDVIDTLEHHALRLDCVASTLLWIGLAIGEELDPQPSAKHQQQALSLLEKITQESADAMSEAAQTLLDERRAAKAA